jgi:hypothetical protein
LAQADGEGAVSAYGRALADLVSALEQSGLDYALGGATALAVWSVPRATLDIDLNLWCAPEELATALRRLEALGVEVPEAALAQAREEGVAYLRWRNIRLDVFVPSVAFYAEALRTRVRLDLPTMGRTWVLSAESLAIFKLLFFRPKDLLDVEKLVQIRGEALNRAYVRKHVVEMVGEDDPRTREWDRLAGPRV